MQHDQTNEQNIPTDEIMQNCEDPSQPTCFLDLPSDRFITINSILKSDSNKDCGDRAPKRF
jgi:hypothetical protein